MLAATPWLLSSVRVMHHICMAQNKAISWRETLLQRLFFAEVNVLVRNLLILASLALVAAFGTACSAAAVPASATPAPGFASSSVPKPESAATTEPAATLGPAIQSTLSPSPSPPPVDRLDATPTTGPSVPATNPKGQISGPAGDLSQIAFEYVKELSQGLGPRESATGQELAAAEYLAARFKEFGYATQLQPFTVQRFSQELSGLTLDTPVPEKVDAIPLSRSSAGTVSGTLVPVGLGRESDLPSEGLAGNIVLVERGSITFEAKVNRAGEAGAAGAVIYNNAPGNFRGTLLESGSIPAAAISREDGQRLVELAAAGEIRATLGVVAEMHPSQNVIAEKPGAGAGVLVLGAHYDTVPDVPGANDNASGAGVLLTLAQQLSSVSLPFTLRFIAFGSEEVGLLGSRRYVDSLPVEERREIIAMLNFDSLGSGHSIRILGSAELTGQVLESGIKLGIGVGKSEGLQGASSDHASFERAGVPVVMFFSPNASRIHSPDDTLEHIEAGLLGDAAGLALALVQSPDLPGLLRERVK